jgi:DNA-binding Lrp family transcriptional regulator
MQDATIDEIDLAIVHALQIAPRASWKQVGAVLGISPVTASRRWERLVGERVAWVTCLPGPALWSLHIVAFVEVDCQAQEIPSVVAALARDPRVASIEVVAGSRDLVLTVFVADLPTLAQFVLDRLTRLKGVSAVRTHLGTGFYAEGADWRLDALSPAQQAQLAPAVDARATGGSGPRAWDRELLLACSADGRRSVAELAELTGTSPSTVRRRLDRVMRERVVSFRCEVSNALSGWPISATFWVSVAADTLEPTARALAGVPQVRLCVAVTGSSNLIVTLWLRSLGDLQRLEALLADRFPGLVVNDRAVALRIPKRIGWRLDEAGRSLCAVPIDLWHDSGRDA